MINAYLVDTVIIKSQVKDKWGSVSETTQKTVKARIDYRMKLVRNAKGEEEVSSARVTVANQVLTYDDLINFDSRDHTILAIEKMKDFNQRYLRISVS